MDVQRSRDKWAGWSTEAIQKYLEKFATNNILGKRSSRRQKKIKYLREVLSMRERAARLICPA